MNHINIRNQVSAVVPAFNEARTISSIINIILQIKEISECIVIDDGSTDNTTQKIKPYLKDSRFVYIKLPKNKGKGFALRTGIKKATNEIILLLDADLLNITAPKIRKIIMPVIKDEVDVSRAGFRRTRGRVTEFAVKPMMRIIFPDISFNQPISGQICAKKSFLQQVNLEDRWGVDIGILLDAIQSQQRITEVNIGKLEHKAQNDTEIAEMARQVLETMIERAGLIRHKYKLVVLTLDKTLIDIKEIKKVFKRVGIYEEIKRLQDLFDDNSISFKVFATKTAKLYAGLRVKDFTNLCENITFRSYTKEVINALKKRKYKVAIISSIFSPIVLPIVKHLGIDIFDCVYLEHNNDKLTGDITSASIGKWIRDDLAISFNRAFVRILHRTKVKSTEAVMVANSPKSLPIFNKAGLSIAFRPDNKNFKEMADKTIRILPEILVVIE